MQGEDAYIKEDVMGEIPIVSLQSALLARWTGGVLSNWISIIKSSFPDANVVNYFGSSSGRINGILYEFKEHHFYNDATLIIKIERK